jgi:glutamine amidotransferase
MIVDYGAGNLNSVKRSLDLLGAASSVSSDPEEIAKADKLILPGVGHFGRAMASLKQLELLDPLHQAVLVKRKPILGICLGMELMAEKSAEGNSRGLGWLDAEVVEFNIPYKNRYKVPHMGWNRLRRTKDSRLMKNVDESSEFYFVHSYHLAIRNQADLLSETQYGISFPSAIEKENIFGVQYHPEKSHDAGIQVLKNFIEM